METDSDNDFSTPPGTPKAKTKKHGKHTKNDLDNKPSTKSPADNNKKTITKQRHSSPQWRKTRYHPY